MQVFPQRSASSVWLAYNTHDVPSCCDSMLQVSGQECRLYPSSIPVQGSVVQVLGRMLATVSKFCLCMIIV